MEDNTVKITISTRTILKIVFIAFAVWLLYLVRGVVAVFFASLFIAALTIPAVDFLNKRKVPRGLAAILTYIGLILLVVLAFYLIIPPLAHQFKDLANSLPGYLEKLSGFFGKIQKVSLDYKIVSPSVDLLKTVGEKLAGLASEVVSLTTSFFSTLATIFVVIVLSFYMTLEKDSLEKTLENVLPKARAEKVFKLVKDVQKKISMWFRGELILCLIIGIASFILLTALGVKYALTLALVAGLLEIVPIIGPIISGILAGLMALIQSPTLALFVVIGFAIIQQLENQFLVPKIMGSFVGLSPVIIIITLLAGAELMGIIGAILAIPVATTLAVLLGDLFEDHKYVI